MNPRAYVAPNLWRALRSVAEAGNSTMVDQSPRQAPHVTPLQSLWSIAYRQRWPLILSLLIALGLGVLAIAMLPKKYTAVSSVQIEQQTSQVIAVPGFDPKPEDADRFLQTQLDRVRSRTIAIDVERSLNIANSPAIISALGLKGRDKERVIRALQENVLAELGVNTRLAMISFTSRDARVSAAIANTYADVLVADNLGGKAKTADRAQEFLLGQLDEAKLKLENSERALLGYARRADLTGTILPSELAQGSQPAQQVEQLADSLAAATARRIDAQQEWEQVRGASAFVLPQVQDNRAYQQLLADKAQLQSELAQDRKRHTDEYPTVKAKRSQVAEIDKEIRFLTENIKQSINQRYRTAVQQEAQMSSIIDQLRNSARAEQDRSVGYNSLEREVETNRVAYDGLLQRYKEVSAGAGAPAANISLVDRAEPPLEPASPNPLWLMAFAGLAGIIAGMVIALLREQMHRVVRTMQDLEDSSGISVLGVVPKLGAGEKMGSAMRSSRSPQSEAFNSLATAVQQAAEGKLPKTLLLTSAQAKEGKSTSTMGLARGLRTLGYEVLVVNGDLRKSSGSQGFAQMLDGTLDPQAVTDLRDKHGITFLDSGPVKWNPVSLLAPARVRPLLAVLSAYADIILVDGPPILGLADAVLLSESVESVLMVVEANRTEATQVDAALSRLPAKVPVAGLLTKFDSRKAGVTYGDYDYYTYGSKGGTAAFGLPAT